MATGRSFTYEVTFKANAPAAAAQIRAALAQQVAAAKAASAQTIAVAKTESAQRIAAARTAAAEAQQLARASASTLIEQEKRATAAYKSELRAREQAARQAARAQAQASGGGLAGGVSRGIGQFVQGAAGSLLPLTAGAAGAVAVSVIGQQIAAADAAVASYRRTSVAGLQLAGTQEKLTALLNAYTQAAGGAVTKADAMARVTQLQAIGFADSTREISRFTLAARGASLATGRDVDYIVGQLQLTIANMSKMRLDQLGLGIAEVNARVAELTKTMPELSTEARFQEAVLSLLIDKFGGIAESGAGAATGLELLQTALADTKLEGQKFIVDFLDPFLRRMAVGLGGGTIADRRAALQGQGILGQRTDALLGRLIALQQAGKSVPADITQRIETLASGVAATGASQPGEAFVVQQQLTDLERTIGLIESGGIVLAQDLGGTGDAAKYATGALIAFGGAVVSIQPGGWGKAAPVFGPAKPPGWAGNTPAPINLSGRDFFGLQGAWLPPAGSTPEQAAIHGAQVQGDIARQNREAAEKRAEADKRAAEAAQREWTAAAKAAQREFESAAKAARSEFESALRGVPGLFGTSQVTADQMKLAELGVPQNFADNYLRRLTDEVLNKVEHADVDIGDAARRAGISPSLPAEAILELFKQSWESGALFADPRNLELINQQAVMQTLAQRRQAQAGQQNIFDFFGGNEQLTALTGLTGNLGADQFASWAGGFGEGASAALATQAPKMVEAVNTSLADQLANGATIEAAGAVGGNLLDLIWGGYEAAIPNKPWVQSLIEHISAQVTEIVADELGADTGTETVP